MKVVSKNAFILSYYKNFMLSLQITKIMNVVGVPIFHLKLKYIITACMSSHEIYGTLHIATVTEFVVYLQKGSPKHPSSSTHGVCEVNAALTVF
jgi:hypothetical protein